jgi:hypothetical protein
MWRIVLDGKGEADAGIAATITPRKGAGGVAWRPTMPPP